MSWFGLRRPRPLRFVYAPEYATTGSTVMRGRQLADIAARSSLSRRDIDYVPVGADLRRADLFLTKGVLKSVDDATLATWRRQGNRLFADPVDEPLRDGIADSVDVIVAASRTATDAYREQFPGTTVATVDHHVDPRVRALMERPYPALDQPRIGYFGERINTVRSKRIARTVQFVQVSTSTPDEGWIARLPEFNVHYAIRRTRQLDQHKPFLKGFTAAACRSVVLIQDDQAEAHRWLPDEYPFWLRGQVTEPAIIDALDTVTNAYGTEQWTFARNMMLDIEQRTSPRAIAAQLVTLFG